jgi:hypothetical protein
MLVEGYAAALPISPRWIALFPSRVVGFLSLSVLFDTVVLVLVSLPVAVLLARFGGRRATAVALIMTAALFVVTAVPSLIEHTSRGALAGFHTPWRLYMAFGYLEFIAVLPLLVWLLRKLPPNNRWTGDLFGAAGMWDSVRPRRLSGVFVRPLKFFRDDLEVVL